MVAGLEMLGQLLQMVPSQVRNGIFSVSNACSTGVDEQISELGVLTVGSGTTNGLTPSKNAANEFHTIHASPTGASKAVTARRLPDRKAQAVA
jgi:hypothetical protein